MRSVRWREPAIVAHAVAAFLGAVLSAALLRKGLVMGPDSWAYWEGSVSLLERHAYGYFGGAPITAFPPLFSLALAAFQGVLGVSAWTLAVALVTFTAIASAAWTALFRSLAGRSGWPLAVATLAVPAALAASAQTLLSEGLWLVLLPLLALSLLGAGSPPAGLRPATVWLLLACALLCRNATVALLPGVVLLWVACRTEAPIRRRLITIGIVVLGAVLPWYGVRRALGQVPAHAFGTGRRGLFAYAQESLGGLATALGPQRGRVGTLLLAAIVVSAACWLADRRVRGPQSRALAAWLAFLGLAHAGHIVLFAATFVAEPLGGRFLVFVALSLGLFVLAAGGRSPRPAWRRAFLALGVLVTAIAWYRVATKYRLAGIEQPVTPLHVTISSFYWAGPPRPAGRWLLVAPPTYPWVRRPD